tara:strand:+ start:328 stop:1329 length:1002 start_codon:yes stop_codon:yes gene_type:complete
MKKINILGVGNALVDKQFLIEDSFLDDISINKGTMGLCEPNFQEQLFKKLSKYYKDSQDACGGSATNTIFAASSLGSNCGFLGKVARDSNGEFYKKDLEEIGIQNNIISDGEENTGTCLIMISPDAERTMSTCLGISAELNFSDIDENLINNSELIYLEGYLVSSDPCFETSKKIIKIGREKKIKISISLSDPNIVKAFKRRLESWMTVPIDYLFCNFEEAKAFCESEDLEAIKNSLLSVATNIFVTDGSKGAFVITKNFIKKINSFPAKAIDTNGAGDMFAGGVLNLISKGKTLEEATKFGCFLASKGVETLGPRLKQKNYLELYEKFKKIN